GTLVTMDPKRSIFMQDLWIKDHVIHKIGKNLILSLDRQNSTYTCIDATGCWGLPGFIQTHVHLCQTLFRNHAEDLELLDWLQKKIWPFEAKLTPAALFLSASLGIAELLKSATTTILDMGTLHHTDELFQSAKISGIRYFGGKAMMDRGESFPLIEDTQASLDETQRLIETWHQKENGRLRYALAPRFALSCSQKLLKACVDLSKKHALIIHTHASENKLECKIVHEQTGKDTIHYLNDLGLCQTKSSFAHGVWLKEDEIQILSDTQTKLTHCPSSNLKLASGIADIPKWLQANICVSLGADGAPCNNTLNIFQEMRLAALIQKPLYGARALSAQTCVEMATLYGAKALGMEQTLGSLESGKLADVVVIQQNELSQLPNIPDDPYTALVYATSPHCVKDVIVHGKILVHQYKLCSLDEKKLISQMRGLSQV
ncbi:MAG: 5'-deoxyadenosine deaminase, partial [Deltaproteobacteria bacterium]|nr:5'-deoxyadenosine deaminase [Deltaproteobacteria bacterium]